MKASLTSLPIWGGVEALLRPLQRLLHLGGVGGITLQHWAVGDQALRAWLARWAALDQIRVGFEDRVHFLLGGNLLSVDYSSPPLIDPLTGRDWLPELLDQDPGGHVDSFDPGSLSDHLACVR